MELLPLQLLHGANAVCPLLPMLAGMRNDEPRLQYPMNKTELDSIIGGVLMEMNQTKRADMWRAILHAVHEQAV